MSEQSRNTYADGYYAGRLDEHAACLDNRLSACGGRRIAGFARALRDGFGRMAHLLAHLVVYPGRVARDGKRAEAQVTAGN